MSHRVIRFGGNQIPENKFTENLHQLLLKEGLNIIVVSAHSGIAEIVSGTISTVFHYKPDFAAIESGLNGIFLNVCGFKATPGYSQHVHSLGKLIKGIHLTGDYSAALKDQVLSYSEMLTAELLRSKFEKGGLDTILVNPDDIGLTVTADFGNATYTGLDQEKLSGYKNGSILILPGSFGKTVNGKIARAGTSASDYTAAALTAFLKAPYLVLWGLDKPFLNADPDIVSDTQRIERLTYAEASELAYFDHYTFHPRTVEPLEEEHIPIKIYNGESGIPETIINTETYVASQIVKGVAFSDDISILKLDGPGVGLKPGILARVTTCLNDAGINIRSVITSQISINFILGKNSGERALQLINQLGFTAVRNIGIETGVSLIGVIGHGMQQYYGVFAKVFTAAAESKINILLSGSGASDLSGYLIVKSADRDQCIREIHKAFFNNERNNN